MTNQEYITEILRCKSDMQNSIVEKGGSVGEFLPDYASAIKVLSPKIDMNRVSLHHGVVGEWINTDADWSNLDHTSEYFYGPTSDGTTDHLNVFIPEGVTSMFTTFYNLPSDIKTIYLEGMQNVTSVNELFYSCANLEEIVFPEVLPKYDGEKYFNTYLLHYTTKIKNITFPQFGVDTKVTLRYLIVSASSLETVVFKDLSNCTALTYLFKECPKLTNVFVDALPSIALTSTYLDHLDLTHESLLSILNALPQGGRTCLLGENNLSKLTDEERAIATSKGWSLM